MYQSCLSHLTYETSQSLLLVTSPPCAVPTLIRNNEYFLTKKVMRPEAGITYMLHSFHHRIPEPAPVISMSVDSAVH